MKAALSAQQIAAILDAGKSPRTKRIEMYERYYDGTIYDGRPSWFDLNAPLRERAPCVVYPAVRNAVQSHVSMCMGGERFVRASSLPNENDEVFDSRFGLDKADSAVLDAGIAKIADQSRLQTACSQILEKGLAAGTAVAVIKVVQGRLSICQLEPAYCEPEFDPNDGITVLKVEVKYLFVRPEYDPMTKKWVDRVFRYRRVINEKFDIVYKDVEIELPGDDPPQNAEKTKYAHGFGFCPVVWYRCCDTLSDIGGIDGRPVHWGLLSMIDAVNTSLSQHNRAALYCGDPQLVEYGVSEDEARIPMGRAASQEQPMANPTGWERALNPQKQTGKVRKKGPGSVWSYESPDAKVDVLALPGDALKVIENDGTNNIKRLRESLSHVHIDPETLAGSRDISGRTLAFIFNKQITFCDALREEFWRTCYLPILNMMLRIVLKVETGLYLPGADKLRPILKRFEASVAGSDTKWFSPMLIATWGDYFPASDQDLMTRSQTSQLDYQAGLITRATAVEHIRTIYNIENVDQYLEELKKQDEEKQARDLDKMKAVASIQGPPGGGDEKSGPPRKVPSRPNEKVVKASDSKRAE